MKKNKALKSISTLLLPLLLLACTPSVEQLQVSDNLHEAVFFASWEPEIKTALQENGAIWWSPGDEIALFDYSRENKDLKYKLVTNCVEPSPTAYFVGEIGNGKGRYCAISPYENSTDYRSGITIPTVQYSTKGSLSPNQVVSIARAYGSNNNHLSFSNYFSGIQFSVVQEGITKFVIRTCGDRPISGTVDYYPSEDGLPFVVTDSSQVSYSVTVYPKEDKCFIPGELYYVTLLPGTDLRSPEISLYTESQVATKTLSFYRWMERSKIARLHEVDKGLKFENSCSFATLTTLIGDYLPAGIDKREVTEIVFHTQSEVKTETVFCETPPRPGDAVSDYMPIYFEMKGTTAHYYTEAEKYRMERDFNFRNWSSLRTLDLSMFDTRDMVSFNFMFEGCSNLETVNLTGFNTDKVQTMVYMFSGCRKLKKVDLSSFSGTPQSVLGMFKECVSLLSIDFGNIDLSLAQVIFSMHRLAVCSKNCAIRCNSATREKLSEAKSESYLKSEYITWILPGEDLPEFEPYRFDYYSTDFSKDKTFKVLHKASVGKGINIILIGDGYSDRMIDNGIYDEDMTRAMNAIFKDEPYASFRDCFNVYEVYAVSLNEISGESHTALYAFSESITLSESINGFDEKTLDNYIEGIDKSINIIETYPILILNKTPHGGVNGVAWMEGYSDDGRIVSHPYAMICRQLGDYDYYSSVIAHEFGHEFACLGDEYVLHPGSMPDWEIEFYNHTSNLWGWWSNVDFTDNPSTVKWSHFLGHLQTSVA